MARVSRSSCCHRSQQRAAHSWRTDHTARAFHSQQIAALACLPHRCSRALLTRYFPLGRAYFPRLRSDKHAEKGEVWGRALREARQRRAPAISAEVELPLLPSTRAKRLRWRWPPFAHADPSPPRWLDRFSASTPASALYRAGEIGNSCRRKTVQHEGKGAVAMHTAVTRAAGRVQGSETPYWVSVEQRTQGHQGRVYLQEASISMVRRARPRKETLREGCQLQECVVCNSPTVAVTPRRHRAGNGAGELRVWAEAGHVDGARPVQGRLAKGWTKTQVLTCSIDVVYVAVANS